MKKLCSESLMNLINVNEMNKPGSAQRETSKKKAVSVIVY